MAKKEYIIKTVADFTDFYVDGIAKLKVAFKPFKIAISGLQRTIAQNSLLHAVFEDCYNLTGIKDAKWWKRELKNKLGLKEVHIDMHDQPTVIVLSTAEYSTKQMAEFCEKIVAYMKIEYGVDIVLPDELKEVKNEISI